MYLKKNWLYGSKTFTFYHPNLNATKLVWATIRQKVVEKKKTLLLRDTWKHTEEEFAALTAEDLKADTRVSLILRKINFVWDFLVFSSYL